MAATSYQEWCSFGASTYETTIEVDMDVSLVEAFNVLRKAVLVYRDPTKPWFRTGLSQMEIRRFKSRHSIVMNKDLEKLYQLQNGDFLNGLERVKWRCHLSPDLLAWNLFPILGHTQSELCVDVKSPFGRVIYISRDENRAEQVEVLAPTLARYFLQFAFNSRASIRKEWERDDE